MASQEGLMRIEQAFRLYDLRDRREAILQELEEYTHEDYRPGRRGTGYRSSPTEGMAEDREDLMEELARVDAEIEELEQEGR